MALAKLSKLDRAQCRKTQSLKKNMRIPHTSYVSQHLLRIKYSGIQVTKYEFIRP